MGTIVVFFRCISLLLATTSHGVFLLSCAGKRQWWCLVITGGCCLDYKVW
ncbi:hypothetical protein HanIR_Chr16g0819191 [Helianthus annuus]|nr:hypothetical protein HanIR_Chr16g0819191 [Helianthus annuus]